MKTVINNEGKKVSVPTFIYNMLKKAYNEGDWMVLSNALRPLLVLCGVMVRYFYYRITDKPKFKMKYKDDVIGQFKQTYKFQKWMLKSGHGVKIVVD